MSTEITTRGMITRCNLPSLNPAQSPLRHCLPLHSNERERPSTLKSSSEYFRKITARSSGRSGFQRLCRIIRGECVCHGPPRRRRRVGVGCPRGWYSLLSETRGCYPTALTIRKRRDGRKNDETDSSWEGGGAGSRSPDYRGDINHLRVTQRDLSEFAINSKLPSSSRRARRLHRISRRSDADRCAIAGDEWATGSISLINGSGRNSMELADADHSTTQMPAERIANSWSVVKGDFWGNESSILCAKILRLRFLKQGDACFQQ